MPPSVYAELDTHLAPVDAALRARYPGPVPGRQPVHTVYVPASKLRPDLPARYGREALAAISRHGPLGLCDGEAMERVLTKLATEPIEDLRIDFEDGYGIVADAVEDRAARAAARLVPQLTSGPRSVPFIGLRCKSLEAPTRHRAIRTLDLFLGTLGQPPPGFRITLPKVSAVAQVEAMELLCGRLEAGHGLPGGSLRFEVQVETPPAVPLVADLITAARGRLIGLHYGTYDYSAAIGIAAAYQSLDHPAADHAKAVMQVAAAGTGVVVSDGSTNVLPVGSTEQVRAAWALHARLVRRGLERGLYQGWDLHPAQLPTRYAATYGFYREAAPATVTRLGDYLSRRASGTLDEPATARAMARFLLRGQHCGALDPTEVGFPVVELEAL